MVPWEQPKNNHRDQKLKEESRQRTERYGRMVFYALGRPGTQKGSNTQSQGPQVPGLPFLTMWPYTDSSTSLSFLLSKGTRRLPHSWCGSERTEQLSLPWKTSGPTNRMRPKSLSTNSAPDQTMPTHAWEIGWGNKQVLNDLRLCKAATRKRTHILLEALWSRMKVTGLKLEGLRFELRTGTFYPGQHMFFHITLQEWFQATFQTRESSVPY